MLVLILGIIVLLGVHTLTTFRETPTSLIERFGREPYKGLHSLVAIVGFALIVWGFARYRADGLIPVWTPPIWTRHLTILLMWFAFVALALPQSYHVDQGCRRDIVPGAKVPPAHAEAVECAQLPPGV